MLDISECVSTRKKAIGVSDTQEKYSKNKRMLNFIPTLDMPNKRIQ